jgi:peptidoglycan/LPS O-acetylase OafA/YrhL
LDAAAAVINERIQRAHWRPDIQGLRAIAVVAVIAYHADLPVPGGFTGVDVFFVISGFVIAGMLQRQWRTRGSVSLREFYWRRFARLTPALALLVSVTVLLAALLLSPLGAQQTTSYTAMGAMLLVANIVITQTTGDYFDAPAATNPLLHTWSLSVEEQF